MQKTSSSKTCELCNSNERLCNY